MLDDRVVELAFVEGLVERSERSFAARGYGHFTLWEGPAGGESIAGLAGLSDVATDDPLGGDVEILWALARSRSLGVRTRPGGGGRRPRPRLRRLRPRAGGA